MALVTESSTRLNKAEAKIEYVAGHQITELLEFKREVEEQGSPILRAVIKDVAELKLEVNRRRDRPDIQDTKQSGG